MSVAHILKEPDTAGPLLAANVDAGDAVRARIHYLVAQNQAVITQTQFADAKAAALMTLMGLIALRGPVSLQSGNTSWIGALALGLICVSILFCLWALMPRFGIRRASSPDTVEDRFTWTVLSNTAETVDAHAKFSRNAEFTELMNSVTASNVGASRVLRKKFSAMRYAFLSALAAVPAIAALLVL